MTIHALDIPDDPERLAGWLEDHVAGFQLGELIAELAAVHGSAGSASAADVLGGRLQSVLDHGLTTLPPPILRQLLQQAAALADLQEQILIRGGLFWQEKLRPADAETTLLKRSWKQIEMRLADDVDRPATLPFRVARPESSKGVESWYRRPWLVSLATAAAVLLAVFTYQRLMQPLPVVPNGPKLVEAPAIAWGWAKPGALPQDAPAKEYFTRLADTAAEWFKKRPETAPDLARRLSEFRQGCTSLFLAENRPVKAADKKWLMDKCRLWAGRIDNYIESLEDGERPSAVRELADKMVERMVKSLREKAAAV